jgi:hypothetical protein
VVSEEKIHMDYALSLNYSELIDHVNKIDSTDVEIAISTSYIELHIGMDSEDRLRMKL